MKHHMRLHKEPFQQVKSGEKKIEIRLLDEKRAKIKIGDEIVFTSRETEEKISVNTVDLLHFKDLNTLVNTLGFYQCFGPSAPKGYNQDWVYNIYSQEEIDKFGLIGIAIELKA